jgi:membrane protein implicated in regulation of membrane protease activity
MVFWVIGIVGILFLLFSLFFDDLLDNFEIGPDWLTGSALGGGLAAFGFAGGIAESLGLSSAIVILIAFIAGLSVAVLAGFITKTLLKEVGSSSYSDQDLSGVSGVVITSIRGKNAGEINVSFRGQNLKLNAINSTEDTVDVGERVSIETVVSANLVVVKSVTIDETI